MFMLDKMSGRWKDYKVLPGVTGTPCVELTQGEVHPTWRTRARKRKQVAEAEDFSLSKE